MQITMQLLIRTAKKGDEESIALHNCLMAVETENKKLDQETVFKGVKAVIEDPAKGFYLVAETGGKVIGNLMITYEWSDWRNSSIWWIQSVYVQKEHRGKNIYKRLYLHVLSEAEKNRVSTIRLYVEKQNHSAKMVYEKLGMKQGIYDFYEVQRDVPLRIDHFLSKSFTTK